MKHVLITGGAGFIGSNVALKLLDKDIEVTVLDNLSPQIHGDNPVRTSPLYQNIKDKVRFINGSVTNREDWLKALDGVDTVLHLAAETGTGQSMYEIEKYVTTNIGGTAILLDILANNKTDVKRVVVAESRAVYGEGRYYNPQTGNYVYPLERDVKDLENGYFEVKDNITGTELKLVATTEDSALHPGSVYGITKQVQGQLVHLVCSSIGIESVSFRYQNVYGPGQSLSNPYTGILSIFSTRMRNGNDINIFEDGKESRDFVYIEDIVDATILGMSVPGISGQVFNIGSGVATDVYTVAETLKKAYNSDVNLIVSGNFRVGDIRHNYADIEKAKKLLGYKPKWDFEHGIAEFVKWVSMQPVTNDNYEKSISEMKEKGLFK